MYIEIDNLKNKTDTIINKINPKYERKCEYIKCIVLKYKNTFWIMTLLWEIYGFLSEKENQEKRIIFHINDKLKKKIILKNIKSFYDDQNINKNKSEVNDLCYDNSIDCYYDIFSKLVFIKYNKEEDLKYYDIEKMDFNEEYEKKHIDNKYKVLTNKYKPGHNKYTNENFIKEVVILVDYYWFDHYFILPQVPYLLGITTDDVIIGSVVEDELNIVGIVSNIVNKNDFKELWIIPTFLILKTLDQIYNKNKENIILPIDTILLKLNNESKSNVIKFKENYYNKYKDEITNQNISIKIIDKNTLISSIDNYKIDDGGKLIHKKTIPINSYFWFFKNLECGKTFTFSYRSMEKKDDKYEENSENNIVTINNNISWGINISDLSYINYKRKYLIEANEYFINNLLGLSKQENSIRDLLKHIYKNKISTRKNLIYFELSKHNSFPTNIRKLKIIKKYKNITEIVEKNSDDKKLKLLIDKL